MTIFIDCTGGTRKFLLCALDCHLRRQRQLNTLPVAGCSAGAQFSSKGRLLSALGPLPKMVLVWGEILAGSTARVEVSFSVQRRARRFPHVWRHVGWRACDRTCGGGELFLKILNAKDGGFSA